MRNNILIIYSSGRIGDTLLLTPAIRAIHENNKGSSITLYGHRNTMFILDGLDFIKKTKSLSKRKSLFFGRHYIKVYDKAFVFSSHSEDPPSRYINLAQRISKKTFCYSSNTNPTAKPHPSTFTTINHQEDEHIIDRFLRLTTLDGVVTHNKQLAYSVLDHERTEALHVLRTLNNDKPTIRIGFQLTSFSTRSFRDWPLDRFRDLIKALLAWSPMVHCYIFGIASDAPAAKDLCQIDNTRVHELTGLKLRPTAAIMEQLDLYIGVDTGPSHLMSAFNKPTIVLYHCQFPSKLYAPLWSTHFFPFDLDIKSSNCNETTPMSLIDWEDVFYKATELLKERFVLTIQTIDSIHSLKKQELDRTAFIETSIDYWIAMNHLYNSSLWDEEDLARRKNAPTCEIADNKRNIDLFNQRRNDAIEKIDEYFLSHISDKINYSSRQNSETLGSIVDRLSIITLKIRAMSAQAERTDVSADHIQQCITKLSTLNTQKTDLSRCLELLIIEILSGTAHYKIYRQFKMYNDPNLNPAVYNENHE